MESRSFHDGFYGSLFQQSRTVETRGQSSSVGYRQSVSAHLLNTDRNSKSLNSLTTTPGTTAVRLTATTENTHADGNVNVESRLFNTVGQRVGGSIASAGSSIESEAKMEDLLLS
ncbi:hypothetical protein Tco_1472711 [Tanacetum coccineum]